MHRRLACFLLVASMVGCAAVVRAADQPMAAELGGKPFPVAASNGATLVLMAGSQILLVRDQLAQP